MVLHVTRFYGSCTDKQLVLFSRNFIGIQHLDKPLQITKKH